MECLLTTRPTLPSPKFRFDNSFFALAAQFTLASLSSCLPHAQAHIGARISPSNFSVLSVGSGSFNFNIHAEKKDSMDWGLRQWAPHLINLVLDRCACVCCCAPWRLSH